MELNIFKSIESADTPFSRLDGRIKTIFFLLGVIVSAVVRQWYFALGLWGIAIALYATLQFPWHHLIHRLIAPFAIAWLVFLSVIFSGGGHVLLVILQTPFQLVVYSEGVQRGILILLRIMASVTWACALSFSTPMVEILETLRACRLPNIIVDIADLMVRYVFILTDTAHNMKEAQTSRTTRRLPWREQVQNTGKVASNVLLKSIDRSEKVYSAMLLRGYNESSTLPVYFSNRLTPHELRTGILMSSLPAVILLVSLILR